MLELGLELLDVKHKWKHSTFSVVFALASDIIVWQIICLKHYKKEKMSDVSGQHLASLTAKTIQSMRNDSDFDLFYQTCSKEAEKIDSLNEPV